MKVVRNILETHAACFPEAVLLGEQPLTNIPEVVLCGIDPRQFFRRLSLLFRASESSTIRLIPGIKQ
jgi:hypothetical protein